MQIVTRETSFQHGFGLPPGEVVPIDSGACADTHVRLMAYNNEEFIEKTNIDMEALTGEIVKLSVSWIHVKGVGDASLIKNLCAKLQVHPLAVEDMIFRRQPPKTLPRRQVPFKVHKKRLPGEGQPLGKGIGSAEGSPQ